MHAVSDVRGILTVEDCKDHERRSVPMPSQVAELVARRCERLQRDALLFPARRGGHQRNSNARRGWWDPAVQAEGVIGLTPHDLRHTAASLAVQAGASVLAVSRMLGHAKPSMTLDTYADLFDSDLDAVADRLSAAFSDVSEMCPSPSVVDLDQRRSSV